LKIFYNADNCLFGASFSRGNEGVSGLVFLMVYNMINYKVNSFISAKISLQESKFDGETAGFNILKQNPSQNVKSL